jgi:hypothetical protein
MVNHFHSIYYKAISRKLQMKSLSKLKRSSFLTARFCQVRQSASSQRQTAADTTAERRRQSARRPCSIFQAAQTSESTQFGLGMPTYVMLFLFKNIRRSSAGEKTIQLVDDGCAFFTTDLVETHARSFYWDTFTFKNKNEVSFLVRSFSQKILI